MNKSKGLWSLIKKWDAESTYAKSNVVPIISNSGNINKVGSDSVSESHLLFVNDINFYDFIESGIKKEVKALINTFNCITYSSCEGHKYENDYEPRNIGVIPRDYEEYCFLKKAFFELITKTNINLIKNYRDCDVYLSLEVDKVETDDGPNLISLEIYFFSLSDDAVNYFNYIDITSNCFLNELKHIKKSD